MSDAGFDGDMNAGQARRNNVRITVVGRPIAALKIVCTAVLMCACAGLDAAPQRHVENGVEYFVGPAGDWVQRTAISGLVAKPSAVEGPLRYRLIRERSDPCGWHT